MRGLRTLCCRVSAFRRLEPEQASARVHHALGARPANHPALLDHSTAARTPFWVLWSHRRGPPRMGLKSAAGQLAKVATPRKIRVASYCSARTFAGLKGPPCNLQITNPQTMGPHHRQGFCYPEGMTASLPRGFTPISPGMTCGGTASNSCRGRVRGLDGTRRRLVFAVCE